MKGDLSVRGGNRPRGAFWRLLQKELRQAAPTVGVITAAVVAWHVFLYTRIGRWPEEVLIGLAALPFGFVPLWLLWRSFATMRQEWSGNHMHLLLSLPIPGWYIAATKLLTVIAETVLFSVVIVTGTGWIAFAAGAIEQASFGDVRLMWGQVAAVAAILSLPMLAWVIITQFAYVAGRLATRLSGLVSFAVFVMGWFVIRMGKLLTPLFRWVPDVPLSAETIVNGVVTRAGVTFDWTPAIGAVFAMGALFWATGSFLERDVEL